MNFTYSLLSLLLKRFDVVWNRNPTLRTLHPDEEFWPEPASIIKRTGFDRSHVRCGRQKVIDADPAFGAERLLTDKPGERLGDRDERNGMASVGRKRNDGFGSFDLVKRTLGVYETCLVGIGPGETAFGFDLV